MRTICLRATRLATFRSPLAAASLLFLFSLGGCGRKSPEELPDEATVHSATAASSSTQAAVSIAHVLFGLDMSALNVTMSAQQNAMLIATQASRDCSVVARQDQTITVAFDEDGCQTPSGAIVTGTVSITVSKSSGTLSVTLIFTNVTVDGKAIRGTVTISTSNATTYTLDLNVTSGSDAVAGALTLTAQDGAVAISGPLTVTKAGISASVVLTAVHYTFGDCYPDGGTVTATLGAINVTATLTAQTAATGQVTVTQGVGPAMLTNTQTLPAHGSCPDQ